VESSGPFIALFLKASKVAASPGLTAKTIPDVQSLPEMFASNQKDWIVEKMGLTIHLESKTTIGSRPWVREILPDRL